MSSENIAKLASLAERAFDDRSDNPIATTLALVALQHGEVVFERYAPEHSQSSTFISWSMAKSMTSAYCGQLVDAGRIDLDAPAAVPEWQPPDPRAAITVRQLLEMRSGLQWNEDYVDDQVSNVIEMLSGDGKADMAGYAASMPLAHEPGEHWYYSSGTTNIVARLLGEVVGGRDAMEHGLVNDLFVPAGMTNAVPKFDDAGTFVGSSFVYATARDFAAFGELFRNRGVANGRRVLSEAWCELSIIEQAIDPETGQGYGLHWWTVRDEYGSYACNGYEGQRIQVVPELGLTFVRLGKTDAAFSADLRAFYREIVACFA